MKFRVVDKVHFIKDGKEVNYYKGVVMYSNDSYSKNTFNIYTDMELKLYDNVYDTASFKDCTIIPKSIVVK